MSEPIEYELSARYKHGEYERTFSVCRTGKLDHEELCETFDSDIISAIRTLDCSFYPELFMRESCWGGGIIADLYRINNSCEFWYKVVVEIKDYEGNEHELAKLKEKHGDALIVNDTPEPIGA